MNVSFQSVDAESGIVSMYAPVFPHTIYRIAKPIADYGSQFQATLPSGVTAVFSCNCILNVLYSELEGKRTPGITGSITFGEIADQLLNQTVVYVTIDQA